HVRMQLAYTLGACESPEAGAALGTIVLRDSYDRFMVAAAMSSVNQRNLEAVMLAVLAGDRKAPPANVLEGLLRLANTTGESRALVTLLDKIAASENGTYAAWQFTALASLLDALEQGNSSLAKLAAGDDKVKASVGQLAGLFDSARQAVADTKAPIDKRREAVRLLGRGFDHQQEDLQTLTGLLVPQAAEELQAAAIATLGRLRGNAAADALICGWKGYSPGLRSQVLDLLLGRPAWTSAALDAVEHKQILPFEIDAAHRQLLLQQQSSTVRERAAKLLAGATDPDRQKVIDSYRSVLTLTGDPQRGAQAFAKTCAAC